ncbi:uncharacterized protein PITG_17442 [Phytophthora infestans T30-4]|uniref:DOT1 domain-containing protein n=1 Tax=Phytophthora infestans (strain T30-4) TaxID=403677 RepID=D0NW27_PHYIT|nr:uncharacterized protein PITG_17442 [Phytophthora infestans T30-4]EEY66863.1 conserved hypothetical protein [Phytophthora infestans T30-4]|eukprot:XP_002896750.1 conserved hypothetical protein [Phytophthora infestans T30-4]
MRSKHSVQALENRLRALKRTYGRDLSRFPPCFFSTSTPTFSHKQLLRLLEPSQAEGAIHDIFSNASAADARQQGRKTDENASEMLPAAILHVIKMIGAVHQDNVCLDIGADLGNVSAQFAMPTIARQCLGIEKRPEASEDVAFFTLSVKFNKALDNKGNVMFLSYLAQHKKKVAYGSSYVKLVSANVGNAYAKLPPAGVGRAYTKRPPADVYPQTPAASRRRWSRSSRSSAAVPSAYTRSCSGRSARTGSRLTARAPMNECWSSKARPFLPEKQVKNLNPFEAKDRVDANHVPGPQDKKPADDNGTPRQSRNWSMRSPRTETMRATARGSLP